jgi:hypothetical protein
VTTTLDDVTTRKKRPEPSAEAAAAAELARPAADGPGLTGRFGGNCPGDRVFGGVLDRARRG